MPKYKIEVLFNKVYEASQEIFIEAEDYAEAVRKAETAASNYYSEDPGICWDEPDFEAIVSEESIVLTETPVAPTVEALAYIPFGLQPKSVETPSEPQEEPPDEYRPLWVAQTESWENTNIPAEDLSFDLFKWHHYN